MQNNNLKFLSKLGLAYCSLQLFFRFVLFFLSAQDVSWRLLDILRSFSLGFVYDLTVALCLLAPYAFFLCFASVKFQQNSFGKALNYLFITSFFALSIFTSVCEYFFWEEFHTRFNFIAVDYLVYTQELMKNIWQSYPVVPILIFISLICVFLSFLFINTTKLPNLEFKFLKRLKDVTLITITMVISLTALHSSYAEFTSPNNYNQEISRNGIFELFHAFFYNELDYERFYITQNTNQVLPKLQTKLSLDTSLIINSTTNTRIHRNDNSLSSSAPNIVVIAVESLSAEYTGLVNKTKSLTPYLDKLAAEAFSYNRVYATGTRTVRGLEAISLSLPPTPGQSIIRRPNCDGLFNAGTPLKKLGYTTQFLYGGYGYFDNMNDFFSSNNFSIFDRTDIPKEEVFFETVWGVADEIIFDKALQQLDKQSKNGPVMQLILTTTNHRPYTFPKNSINEPQGKRESVVKYTDWSIHRYLQEAKNKPWFDNTVFVILADHNANVAGKTGLPISKYHIPCLVFAPKLIKPGQDNRLMSQIDVLPTVYGMLGMTYETKNLGYDINKLPEGKERAFIATYQQLGYIAEDTLVVLEPNKKVSAYKINDYTNNKYSKIQPSQELVNDAITWYQGASILYKNNLLKLNTNLANTNTKEAFPS